MLCQPVIGGNIDVLIRLVLPTDKAPERALDIRQKVAVNKGRKSSKLTVLVMFASSVLCMKVKFATNLIKQL